jgi:hypothetical protein
MITDIVLIRALESVTQAWRQEAEKREQRWPGDPLVLNFRQCAAEIDGEIARVQGEERPLTVAEYAASHGAIPATVRRWIARGELEASRDAAGDWRIPRHARRVRPLRRALQKAS